MDKYSFDKLAFLEGFEKDEKSYLSKILSVSSL